MAKFTNQFLGGVAALFTFLTLLLYLWHERDHDKTDYTMPIIIAGMLVVSIAASAIAVARNLKEAKNFESRQAAVDNASAQKIVNLEAREKRLLAEVGDLTATVKGEQQENQRLREAMQQGADYSNRQAIDVARLSGELAKAQVMNQPIIDAPSLIVKCPKDSDRKLAISNDGPSAAINVDVGPLVHKEEHEIRSVYSPFGSILPSKTEERNIAVAKEQPNSTSTLWSVIREGSMNPDPIDLATIHFDDSRGRQFSQQFVLTAEADGSVTWTPGPVRLRHALSDASVET